MHLSAMYSTVVCILIVIKVLKNDLCHKRVLIEPPYLQFNQTLKLLMPFRIVQVDLKSHGSEFYS